MGKTLMKLRLFRVEKGMNIEQFAEKVGYARRHYSNIEKGITKPTTRLIEGLVKAFGISVNEACELCIREKKE